MNLFPMFALQFLRLIHRPSNILINAFEQVTVTSSTRRTPIAQLINQCGWEMDSVLLGTDITRTSVALMEVSKGTCF